jgi:uncharacterized protein (DUF1778 family)
MAADLEDTAVTEFVLDAVTTRAKGVLKQHQDLVLSGFQDGPGRRRDYPSGRA